LRWPSAGFRREPVGAGLAPPEAGLQPGSSFSLATAFRFLATRHCSSQSMVRPVAEGLSPA